MKFVPAVLLCLVTLTGTSYTFAADVADATPKQENAVAGTGTLQIEDLRNAVAARLAAEGVEPEDRASAVEVYVNALFNGTAENGVPADVRRDAIAALAVAYCLQLRREDASKAIDYYDDVVLLFPETAFAAEALFQKAIIKTDLHQFEKAFDEIQTLFSVYPGSTRIGDALTQGYIIAEMVRNGARPYKWNGRLPWLKDRKSALRFYDALYSMAPNSAVAPRLLYQKGVFAFEISHDIFEGDRAGEAIDSLERLITNHPDSQLVPDAYLLLAEIYSSLSIGDEWEQSTTKQAINYYTDFYSLYPDHPKAEFAFHRTEELRDAMAKNRISVGDFYYSRQNNLRAAVVFYNEAITFSPNSPAGKEAAEKIARIRNGIRAPNTLIDWIFGRYPAPVATDFLDAPSQKSLDSMGFQQVREAGDDSSSSESTSESGF